MKNYLFLTLSCFLMVLAGCKKNGNGDAGPTEKPVLSFTKNAYAPYEVAILQADKDFTAEQIAATIEGASVGMALLDSNRIGLLIPVLPSGKHTLVIESDIFQSDTVSFTIGSYTPIADPAQTITQYMDGFDGQIQQLQRLKDDYGVNISPENMDELKAMQQALSDAIATATQEEKEALAQFIEANQLMSFSMDNFPYRDSFYAKTVTDPGDELMAIGKTFVKSTIAAAVSIAIFVAATSAPDLTITKILALAAGGSALAVIVYARNVLVERLTGCLGKAADFIWEGELMKTTGTPLVFSAGGTMPLADNMKFRNLQDGDLSENNYIHTIVSKLNVFAGYWKTVQDGLAKLKSWFFKVPEKLSGGPVAFAEETYKIFPAKQEYLSISNVSDDRIQLAIVDEQGEKRIKATTTETLEEETPFTFDITYKHPELGNSVTKTIQAVFKNSNILDEIIAYGPAWMDPDGATQPDGKIIYTSLHFGLGEYYTFGTMWWYDGSDEHMTGLLSTCVKAEGNIIRYCTDGVKVFEIRSVSPSELIMEDGTPEGSKWIPLTP